MDYLCNCKSEIVNVWNPVEDHCLRAMKIVHHHANGRLDSLISGHQSVNPLREVISILSGKYKRFTFVHPASLYKIGSKALTLSFLPTFLHCSKTGMFVICHKFSRRFLEVVLLGLIETLQLARQVSFRTSRCRKKYTIVSFIFP